jgi:hypothetical protein
MCNHQAWEITKISNDGSVQQKFCTSASMLCYEKYGTEIIKSALHHNTDL